MPEVKSAIQKVKPTKGEKRAAATSAAKDAREALSAAKATFKSSEKAAKDSAKVIAGIQKQLDKQLAKPNPNKVEQREQVKTLKDGLKGAKAANKQHNKDLSIAGKAQIKAQAAADKAKAAKEAL